MSTEAPLAEADAGARQDALDVSRSFIVQAPAGSGKTELLIQRYLRLLDTVDEPEEVVAITFTQKAAAEMQERVSLALLRARDDEPPEKPHERLTHTAALGVLARDASNNWGLLEARSRMRIQTLDALCAGIVRLLPVTSGIGGTGETVQDEAANDLYRQAALSTLDWLATSDSVADEVEALLLHLDNAVSTYVDYLAAMLATRDQWLEITGVGHDDSELREALEAVLESVVARSLERLAARFSASEPGDWLSLVRYAAKNLAESGETDHPVASLAFLQRLPGTSTNDLSAWQGLATLCLTDKGDWRRRLDKNTGFPPTGKQQKADWLDTLGRMSRDPELAALLRDVRMLPPGRYSDAQWRVMQALLAVLPLAVSELKRLFAELGVTDHAEVSMAAAAALGSADAPGDVALMLDYRIRHLLVDEMQDTSIAQYRLLETLTAGWEAGDGRTLFAVGDPMQSIYRFRNAEVGQFVKARAGGIGSLPLEPLTLSRNFRSGSGLVSWFNNTFEKIFPAGDDALEGAVAYSPSEAAAGADQQCRTVLHALRDATGDEEADATVRVVQECLAVNDSDRVAVLVRSRTQLPALLARFRGQGIAYEAVEIDRLTDRPEILDVVALTRSLSHPLDRAAWIGLLHGPLVGLRWRDIHALVADDPDAALWDLVCDADRVAALSADGRERLQAFSAIMATSMAPSCLLTLRDRVERAWFHFGGPSSLEHAHDVDNVYRYFDIVERLDRAGTLADPARLADALDAERVSSHAQPGCRVFVMTMHKSKGLEFEHVVLPSLARQTRLGDRPVLAWIRLPGNDGESRLLLSPVGSRTEAEQDPIHRFIAGRQKERDRLENDRMLYVACTRAMRSLHLVASLDTAADGGTAPPKSGSLLARLWPAVGEDMLAGMPPADDDASEIDDDALVELPLRRRSGAARPIMAPPPPARLQPLQAAAEPLNAESQYDWVGRAARHAGTLVHRWLKRFAEEGAPAELPDLRPATRTWARDLGVSGEELDIVAERVQTAVDAMLADQRGRWLLESEGFAELALTGVTDGYLASVVLDRVVVDDGCHWIVDYKTSSHEGGNRAGFIAQEIARYSVQLARYASLYRAFAAPEKIRCALYFPLMQVFTEVDVPDSS